MKVHRIAVTKINDDEAIIRYEQKFVRGGFQPIRTTKIPLRQPKEAQKALIVDKAAD